MKITLTIIAVLVWASTSFATVTINKVRPVNDEIQLNRLTISYGGTDYKYNANSPVLTGSALQTYMNGKKNQYVYGILHNMYPNARPVENTLASFQAWITAGRANAAYCKSKTATTEQDCTEAGGTWIPQETITKVPWVDSHEFTGDLRTRKLEQLNAAQIAYIADHYDQGTQASFTALFVLPTTPQVVKDALLPVWTWIQNVTVYYYGKKVAIRDGEDWESVTWDFSTFDATDPNISLEALMQ